MFRRHRSAQRADRLADLVPGAWQRRPGEGGDEAHRGPLEVADRLFVIEGGRLVHEAGVRAPLASTGPMRFMDAPAKVERDGD